MKPTQPKKASRPVVPTRASMRPGARPAVPDHFDRYTVRGHLASGGMASVYLAQLEGSHGVEKLVALKVIHPHLARDRRFVNMFLDEARVLSQIQHPNVCDLIDFGEADGLPYLVMEYLHGETFSRVIHRGLKCQNFPSWLAVRIVADVARGLSAAHRAKAASGKLLNVVHRDITPQNIVVLYDGVAKLMDFGIARTQDRLTHTEAGTVKGKFAYMAPEQVQSEQVDHRSDIWALGVVLWEALAGRRLFMAANEASTAVNVIHAPIPTLTDINATIPPALQEIVSRALMRDKEQRLASAAEFADDLENYLYSAGTPTGASQVGQWMSEVMVEESKVRERLLSAPILPSKKPPQASPPVANEFDDEEGDTIVQDMAWDVGADGVAEPAASPLDQATLDAWVEAPAEEDESQGAAVPAKVEAAPAPEAVVAPAPIGAAQPLADPADDALQRRSVARSLRLILLTALLGALLGAGLMFAFTYFLPELF